MDDESSGRVECAKHGRTLPTFACLHLAAPAASGLGVSYDGASDEPWPDIVCDACAAEPPWSDELAIQRWRVLCTRCWENAFASNTAVRHATPDAWLHDALHRGKRRHDRWVDEYGITSHARYRYALQESPPWLGFGASDDRFTLLCEPSVLGSWSSRTNTWLWGWANDYWESPLTRASVRVKRLGERLGIERLWRGQFESDESLAWGLCSAALDALPEFDGIYRSPSENGALFLAARNTRRVT
jgi:hypothetical protein